MAVVHAFKAGAEVLRAMGMNPDQVGDFSVHFDLNDAVILKAKIYLSQEQIDSFVGVLKQYDVVLRERSE